MMTESSPTLNQSLTLLGKDPRYQLISAWISIALSPLFLVIFALLAMAISPWIWLAVLAGALLFPYNIWLAVKYRGAFKRTSAIDPPLHGD